MTIHREGYAPLLFTAGTLLVINYGVSSFTSWPTPWPQLILALSIILFLLILQFFRNPKISTNLDDNSVYAPADGKVVVIEKTQELEYFDEPRLQVSIFMSPLNVHVNRNPVSGVIKMFKYHAGKYLVAWHPKSSTDNERTTMVVETASGIDILVRQIAGAVARRIKYYVNEGDSVTQGEEFGFIRFGSRVDLFLPLESKILVKVGQKTTGGKTIIANL